jgi:diaminopimelate decarboxylase
MNVKYIPPKISTELGSRPIEAAVDRSTFARGRHHAMLANISGAPVADLAREFGTPLFVYAEKTVREQAHTLREAFESRYPDVSFVWSFKTNYLDAICQILRSEGWGAEVVSDFEYEKARKQGFEGSEIIYNGPYKPQESLKTAIREKALVQIDNWDELGQIEDLATSSDEPIEVGLRVWMDTGIKPVWSRFGFALASGEAERAAARIITNPKLYLHTLHTHIGTYILAPAAYRTATQKLVALRDALEDEYGHLTDCLNLGGGFPSYSLLHGMPGPAEKTVPPVADYAEAITAVLRRLPPERRPLLRLETGRYLVDEAGYLLSRVVAVRDSGHAAVDDSDLSGIALKERMLGADSARLGYVIDAGLNLLYTSTWFQIDALPEKEADVPPVPARLFGPLCMAIDVLRDRIELPPLSAGDLLTLRPVGAYNQAQSMQFISYRPAAVLVTPDGTAELIHEREILDDIQHNEHLPAHLRET